MSIFCKKRPFSKKSLCSHAYILSKKRPFSPKHCALMSFFPFFYKKPLLQGPYLVQKKRQSCQNHILWVKKVNRGYPFFSNFSSKIKSLISIFCQHTANSIKTLCSIVHILSKNINSLKHTVPAYLFYQICHEKPPAFVPIVGQKNVTSIQTTPYQGPTKVNRM